MVCAALRDFDPKLFIEEKAQFGGLEDWSFTHRFCLLAYAAAEIGEQLQHSDTFENAIWLGRLRHRRNHHLD